MKSFIGFSLFVVILLLGNCQEQSSKSRDSEASSDTDYLQSGKAIASETFVVLSSELQKAMQKGGLENAIHYCKIEAVPLVDSLSKVHQAQIRRTALRVRNPANKATPAEVKQLEAYQAAKAANEPLQPLVQTIDASTVAFYAPIQMMPLCEKCHGTPGETLANSSFDLLKQLYPEDEAINFATGDLRGMWSIQFKR